MTTLMQIVTEGRSNLPNSITLSRVATIRDPSTKDYIGIYRDKNHNIRITLQEKDLS